MFALFFGRLQQTVLPALPLPVALLVILRVHRLPSHDMLVPRAPVQSHPHRGSPDCRVLHARSWQGQSQIVEDGESNHEDQFLTNSGVFMAFRLGSD